MDQNIISTHLQSISDIGEKSAMPEKNNTKKNNTHPSSQPQPVHPDPAGPRDTEVIFAKPPDNHRTASNQFILSPPSRNLFIFSDDVLYNPGCIIIIKSDLESVRSPRPDFVEPASTLHIHTASCLKARTCFHLLILWSIAIDSAAICRQPGTKCHLEERSTCYKNKHLLTQTFSLESLQSLFLRLEALSWMGIKNRGAAGRLQSP